MRARLPVFAAVIFVTGLCGGVALATTLAPKLETDNGVVHMVDRQFNITVEQCLASIKGNGQIWSCRSTHPGLGNAYEFNPAWTTNEVAGIDCGPKGNVKRYTVKLKALPNGAKLELSRPDPDHPGYSAMIDESTARDCLVASANRWSTFTFKTRVLKPVL